MAPPDGGAGKVDICFMGGDMILCVVWVGVVVMVMISVMVEGIGIRNSHRG
jgi:hypothetical protein